MSKIDVLVPFLLLPLPSLIIFRGTLVFLRLPQIRPWDLCANVARFILAGTNWSKT
jgi:hypothetical protein